MDPNPKDPYAPDKPPADDGCLPDLKCAVCFSRFNNVFKMPKMLECKHTFCLECLACMNVKSLHSKSIQCPLCRAYTRLPDQGLPKLTTDSKVLSHLPEAMQQVYSIRFSRDQGKLLVERVLSSSPPSMVEWRNSMDLGLPIDVSDPESMNERPSFFTGLVRTPLRALLVTLGVLTVIFLIISFIFLLAKKIH